MQGSLEPGETLPLKLKWILRREFWPQFQNLLKQGNEVGGHTDVPGVLQQYRGTRAPLVRGHADTMGARGHPQGTGQGTSPLGRCSHRGGMAGGCRHTAMASHHASACTFHERSPCGGHGAPVSSGVEELWGNAPAPLRCLREAARALLGWHHLHHAQVHKGYLDDPRNTDNAWVETVAVSIHFDNQNDVEMKRLNSVWAPCLRSSLPRLSASVGRAARSPEPDLALMHAVEEGRGDEHGVAPRWGL